MTGEVNWDADWSNCEPIYPKASKYRWCSSCHLYHDHRAFNHFHGKAGMCVVSINNRRKVMAKVKGGPTSSK